jgi:hypothetical protein
MVMKNPEVTGVLITTGYVELPQGILSANEPREIRSFHAGRSATRTEVEHAIEAAAKRDDVKRHPNRDEIVKKLATLPLPVGE